MKLQAEIQEAVLYLLCHDDDNATLLSELVPVETFDPYYQEIAEQAVSHRARFERVPGEHTYDLVKALGNQRPDSADIYTAIFDSMQSFKDGIQPEFVIGKAREFARFQQIRSAWVEMGRGLDKDDVVGLEQAEAALANALTPLVNLHDPGMSMADPEAVEQILSEVNSPIIPVGIPELDRTRAGLARGRLNCLMGGTGKGKSWWLIHCAKEAARRNFRVLYLTMEMDEVEVAQRLYQSFFSVTDGEAIDRTHKIVVSNEGTYDGLTEVKFPTRPTLKDEDAHAQLHRNVNRAAKGLGKIRIKGLQQNQLTVQGIEGLLDTMGSYSGFFPDVVLIDYADLMKKDPRDIRGSLRLIYEDLKALAQRRNLAIGTVTQSNRSGIKADVQDATNMSEDISKAQTADALLTYNQSDAEHSIGFARIWVDKNRRGKDKYTVAITQNYGLGQFCLSSTLHSSRVETDVKQMSGENDEAVAEAVEKRKKR